MTIITVTLNTSVDRTLEVPGFAVGGHLKGRMVRVQPGGKGVNVARCLAALGVPSVATGLVGRGELPLFRNAFRRTPVRLELVPVAAPTRTNTTILDPERGTDTHIREAGSPVTSREVEALRSRLCELASPDAIVVFCGSLPPGMGDEALAELLAVCRERGARLAADLNGQQLHVAVAARALLIKPNVEELGSLLGVDLGSAAGSRLVRAARSLCGRVRTALLTRGRLGALLVERRRAMACSVEVAAPRNTVGCGDAFLAGYLAGVWRGRRRGQALRLAVACGAAQAEAEAPGRFPAERAAELASCARLRTLV